MGKKYTVRCKSLDREGRGLVSFNNSTFAVPYLLEGEKAEISLVYGRGRDNTGAELVTVLEPSADRVEPACPHFKECGGCNWMHMSYEKQLREKERIVRENLESIFVKGKAKCPAISPIIAMDTPLHYRNKVHSTFARDKKGKIVTGLYRENTHKVVPIKQCLLEQEAPARIMQTIRKFVEDRKIKVYDERTETGLMRHVLFRVAANGDVMVVPVIAETMFREKNLLVSTITKAHPEVKTIVLNYNLKRTTMVLGIREEVLFGTGVLEDTMNEIAFRLSPRSFYQVNYAQTKKLYEKVVEFADLKPGETVLDAYCGIGTITAFLAKAAPQAKVLGVELNEDAVKDANINAKRNNLENAHFVNQDAGQYITALAAEKEHVDVLVMDPPRSGSSEAFLKATVTLKPRRIVYVSCEPDTLARDLKVLCKSGYRLEKVQPVDMFPQTSKVETVVLLSGEKVDGHIDIDLDSEKLEKKAGTATYAEIKDYIKEKYGFSVTSLYIGQIKDKVGIKDRKNYNTGSGKGGVPTCPKEKEEAIMDAFKHFGLV